jgi:hypothetical protein
MSYTATHHYVAMMHVFMRKLLSLLLVTISLKTAFKINRPIKQNENDMSIPSGKRETEFISEECGYVLMQEAIEFPKANQSKKIRI